MAIADPKEVDPRLLDQLRAQLEAERRARAELIQELRRESGDGGPRSVSATRAPSRDG